MSPHLPFSDRRQFLEALARGRCSAAQRPDGVSIKWLPTVAGEIVTDCGLEVSYAMKRDAVAAAKRAQDKCREALAEAQGAL